MKQPAYEKPEGRDAAALLTAEEVVVETEVANPELLLSDAELLIVEDELLSAEELLIVEDGLPTAEELLNVEDEPLDAEDELLGEEDEAVLDADVADPELMLESAELLEAEGELLIVEETDVEGVLDSWLWLALSEEALLELPCDEAEETEDTEEASTLDWLELDVVLDAVVVSVPLVNEADEALILAEDDTVPAEDERLLDEEADEDDEEEAEINFAPEM
jgi:hypothetical protein